MEKKGLLLLLIIFLIESCVTPKWKINQVSSGDMHNVIDNILTDFIHTSHLVKKDSIYNLLITDFDSETLIIGVSIPSDIVHPSYKNKVGTYDPVFPTQYVIKGDKLFYWSDSTQVITQEILDVLQRYNHIDYSWSELPYEVLNIVNDDGIEGVLYFICKNNYINYEKTGISNISKRYKTPVLKCK